jgi:hypothetical protein
MENENPTAVWIRKKLRANEPFLLDELTPAGVELYVALGWPDDEKKNGYQSAKAKVANRVPAQDWSLVSLDESNLFPEKSQEINGETRGRKKQQVAISANGMKHLLAHVPNQELANTWLQYLIDAEHVLRLVREASTRDDLTDSHKKNHGAVIERHGVRKGQGMIAIANNMTFDKSKQAMQAAVKEECELKGKVDGINPWNHATPKSMAVKDVLAGNIKLAAHYATGQTTAYQVAAVASNATLNTVELMSGGADIVHVPRSDGKGVRRAVEFQVREGIALPPSRARNELSKDRDRRQAEEALTPQLPGLDLCT